MPGRWYTGLHAPTPSIPPCLVHYACVYCAQGALLVTKKTLSDVEVEPDPLTGIDISMAKN